MKTREKDIDAMVDKLADSVIAHPPKQAKLPISKEYVKNILLKHKDTLHRLYVMTKNMEEAKAIYIEGNCQDKDLKQEMDELFPCILLITTSILDQVNQEILDAKDKRDEVFEDIIDFIDSDMPTTLNCLKRRKGDKRWNVKTLN